MKMVSPFVNYALLAAAMGVADRTLAAPALKTDQEVRKFLFKYIEDDKTYANDQFGKMIGKANNSLTVKRQDDLPKAAVFKKYFKKHELWLVKDESFLAPGPGYAWLLALDRETPKAYLLSTNRAQEFAKDTAALFAAEKVAPKDENEALELGQLVVSLVRYSSFKEAKALKDVPAKVLKKWTAAQISKFTEPTAKKDKGFRVTYPVYEDFNYIPHISHTLIIYEIEFPESGELKLNTTRVPIQ